MGKFSFEAFANYENYDSIAQSSDAMLPQRTSWPIGQYSFETVKSKKAGVPV